MCFISTGTLGFLSKAFINFDKKKLLNNVYETHVVQHVSQCSMLCVNDYYNCHSFNVKGKRYNFICELNNNMQRSDPVDDGSWIYYSKYWK